MRTALLTTVALLVLTGCDGQEQWQGHLMATGWGDLPATPFPMPASSLTARSEQSCNKGMTALHNQWRLFLTDRIQTANNALAVRAAAAKVPIPPGFVRDENMTALERAKALAEGKTEPKSPLEKEIEAWTRVKDTMWQRCLLIKYTPPPFEGFFPESWRQQQP